MGLIRPSQLNVFCSFPQKVGRNRKSVQEKSASTMHTGKARRKEICRVKGKMAHRFRPSTLTCSQDGIDVQIALGRGSRALKKDATLWYQYEVILAPFDLILLQASILLEVFGSCGIYVKTLRREMWRVLTSPPVLPPILCATLEPLTGNLRFLHPWSKSSKRSSQVSGQLHEALGKTIWIGEDSEGLPHRQLHLPFGRATHLHPARCVLQQF